MFPKISLSEICNIDNCPPKAVRNGWSLESGVGGWRWMSYLYGKNYLGNIRFLSPDDPKYGVLYVVGKGRKTHKSMGLIKGGNPSANETGERKGTDREICVIILINYVLRCSLFQSMRHRNFFLPSPGKGINFPPLLLLSSPPCNQNRIVLSPSPDTRWWWWYEDVSCMRMDGWRIFPR